MINKKILKYFAAGLTAALLILGVILKVTSMGATEIFNDEMKKQTLLVGTIEVEDIEATLTGEVFFTNLTWKDERGGTILDIPEGSFKVSVFDVLTGNFSTSTIRELYLKGASVSLNLDENMNVDFIRHSKDFEKVNADMKSNGENWEQKVSRVNKTEDELKQEGERRRRLQRSKIEKDWKNFNLEGRKLNLNLKLDTCNFEVFFKERHYLLRDVDIESKINTDTEATLKIYTGKFGGTMIGRGMYWQGTVDFKSAEVPQCNLTIQLQEVDPSSLGMGLNIHDTMTLTATFTGPVSQPVGNGKVKLDKLTLPGISFTNVDGKIHYENDTLTFTDVSADVYDGKLTAKGDYNIDTRYYNIYGFGKNLSAYTALPDSGLHCKVALNIAINSKGNPKETVTSGDFVSDEGRYSIVAFKKISGKFRSEYGAIHFYDVAIDIGGYKISTDALSIIDGKLSLAPINITDDKGATKELRIKD